LIGEVVFLTSLQEYNYLISESIKVYYELSDPKIQRTIRPNNTNNKRVENNEAAAAKNKKRDGGSD
jgi:hypothetical protein